MPTIAVIDTGICNLRSVTKALQAVGAVPRVVRSQAELAQTKAQGLVLPGVGALRDCVASLLATEMDRAVREWIGQDRPFLGVCLGMQALFERSEEGDVAGLGVIAGRVVRFIPVPDLKIPHMGWNTIRFRQPVSPLAAGFVGAGQPGENGSRDGNAFYFVHSYYCVPADPGWILADCEYGGRFTAAIGRGCVFATQFHPEKSQANGLQIYRNFAAVAQARK
jgi:imidazole glycerol-phosphate synthase subunit HisH